MVARVSRKPKPAEPIRHDTFAPAPVQAAQIAILVIKKVKCQTWKAVIELSATTDIREHVVLSAEQQALIDEYRDVLPYLSTSPLVTVIACTACNHYGLQDKRAAGAKCIFTFRCEGKLVKASSAAPRRPKAMPAESAADQASGNDETVD
jgi:hypothetical protein